MDRARRRAEQREKFAAMPLAKRILVVGAGVASAVAAALLINFLLADEPTTAGDGSAVDELVKFSDDGFTIRLPENPEHTQHKVPSASGEVTTDMYVAVDDEASIALSTATYPDGVVDLDGAVRGAARAVDAEVQSSEEMTYQGYDAREFRLVATQDGRSATVFARVIDVDGKLFQIQLVLADAETKTAPEFYAAVADSLQFD